MQLCVTVGVFFSVGMGVFAAPIANLFLSGDPEAAALCISFLKLISWFYLLSFFGNSFVGWFRGCGRMSVTFWGTTMQISIRVIGTYLLVSSMGLDSVALSTGIGWSCIVLYQFILFRLQSKKLAEA